MKLTLAMILTAGLSISPAFAQELVKPSETTPVERQPEAQPRAELKSEPKPDSPKIEVVFVLDTTGSMSGLIEGAKQKIWSIANAMATAKPHPQIRMGIVAYRDRGDDYITKLTPMTDDLDALYSDLMKLQASGGGDGPESVNQALHEAYTKFDWTPNTGTGTKTLRLIYLVGDAPPHMDYVQDVLYKDTCADAIRHGITINTVQCGSLSETTPFWKEIALKTDGEYLAIQQSGGMRIVASPYDDELAKLGIDLESTVVACGSAEQQSAQTRKMAAADVLSAAPASAPAAKADRAMYKASAAGRASLSGENDLVQQCMDGKVDLAKYPEEKLPENMKKMTLEERQTYITQKTQERKDKQAKIEELSQKRAEFVKQELAKDGGKPDSFDDKVKESLARQAKKVGISYEKK